jgi:hypothetical protein
MSEKSEAREKLLNQIRDAISQDADLRIQLGMGDKFRFVRDKLHALLASMEEDLKVLQEQTEQKEVVMADDEMYVYVYLFNSQGSDLQTWRNMVSPDVFYEYSVNRPIYKEREQVEKFVNAKSMRTQHAYLIVVVKKEAVIESGDLAKDTMGNALLRVKEGALKITNVASFVHNALEYNISKTGAISKKD